MQKGGCAILHPDAGLRALVPRLRPRDGECLLWFQLQVNLLSKFLLIAKSCYEQRNFATAMQILGGLEHPAVRQSPVSHLGDSWPWQCHQGPAGGTPWL